MHTRILWFFFYILIKQWTVICTDSSIKINISSVRHYSVTATCWVCFQQYFHWFIVHALLSIRVFEYSCLQATVIVTYFIHYSTCCRGCYGESYNNIHNRFCYLADNAGLRVQQLHGSHRGCTGAWTTNLLGPNHVGTRLHMISTWTEIYTWTLIPICAFTD